MLRTQDSTTTTTTTTIPESVITYLESITAKIESVELGKKVLETNQRWDDKTTTYQQAQQEFQEFIDDFLFNNHLTQLIHHKIILY